MRVFLKDISNEIIIDGDEFRHIVKVMRMGVGEELCVFNGDGKNYVAKITQIFKDHLCANVFKSEPNMAEPKKQITIFLSLLKGEKMELVVQKITELGATKLVLFESINADRKKGNINFERLNKIAVSASKQCGRSSVLEICEMNAKDISKEISKNDLALVFHEKVESQTIKQVFASVDETKVSSVALVIGPEGGLTQSEVEEYEKYGAKAVSLGKLIFRAETACIYGMSVVSLKFLI